MSEAKMATQEAPAGAVITAPKQAPARTERAVAFGEHGAEIDKLTEEHGAEIGGEA